MVQQHLISYVMAENTTGLALIASNLPNVSHPQSKKQHAVTQMGHQELVGH
jgi:hypothetical protein